VGMEVLNRQKNAVCSVFSHSNPMSRCLRSE
jgi:hypothetical protein